MTPESQRIAIAEACGWVRHGDEGIYGCWDDPQGFTHADCPDYLNDLNAMHEAEKVLDERDRWNYGNTLALSVLKEENAYFGQNQDDLAEPNLNGFGHFALATLTAAQRAEAFLKTLGLWKEESVSAATVEGLR